MAETTMRFVIAATGDQAEKVLDSFGAKMHSVTKGFVKSALEIGGAYVALSAVKNFVSDSIKATEAAQLSNTLLATAVKNSGNKMSAFAPQVEEADASMRKFGFTNAETQTALSTLVVGLKDPAKALKILSVAADLAKAKNMDLNSAALLVTKGMEGQTRPLKALGIDLPVYAGNAQMVALAQIHLADAQQKVADILAKTPGAFNASSKANAVYEAAVDNVTKAQEALTAKQSSGQAILDAISSRLKGSASAAAETYAGKVAAVTAQWDNVQEKAGAVLMPVLEGVVTWLDAHGIPALQHFADGWNGVTGAMGHAAEVGRSMRGFMNEVGNFFNNLSMLGKADNVTSSGNPFAVIGNWANNTAPRNRKFADTTGQNKFSPVIPGFATGGTFAPQTGGHIVRLAEAGRSETIVDTASLNRAIKQPRSAGVTIGAMYMQPNQSMSEFAQELGWYGRAFT